MKSVIERRFSKDLRAEEGQNPKLVGYATVFNQLSVPLWGFREVFKPGAFARIIREGADVRALVEHDPSRIIGRTKSGTLRLSEDDRGLRAEIDPPDTQVGRDLVTNIRRGDLDGMSIGFISVTEDWRKQDGEWIREVRDANLFDVSPVAFPAFPQTSVNVRAFINGVEFFDVHTRELGIRLASGYPLQAEDRLFLDGLEKVHSIPAVDDPFAEFETLKRRHRLAGAQF